MDENRAITAGAHAAFDHTHAAWTALLDRHVHWNAAGTASAVNRAVLGQYLETLGAETRQQYTAKQLDAQLRDQTQRFLRDRSRNRLLTGMSPTLELSSIFDWYEEDFAAVGGVATFQQLHRLLQRAADARRGILGTGVLNLKYTRPGEAS